MLQMQQDTEKEMNPEKTKQTAGRIGRLIRYTIMAALLYGIYRETGICTTIVFALIFIENELKTFLMSKVVETQSWTTGVLMRIIQKCQEASDENSKED